MSDSISIPVHESMITTRWGDQDQYGHINNAVYLRFAEEARVRWLNDWGFRVDGQDTGPILLKAAVLYKQEINYPSTLRVTTELGKPGRTSLPVIHQILDADNDTVYSEVETIIVWMDHEARRPIPLPDKLKAHQVKMG